MNNSTKRTATGTSKNYSFDEAFKKAITNLEPAQTNPVDGLTKIIVKEIGAHKGGLHGLDELYVIIEAN